MKTKVKLMLFPISLNRTLYASKGPLLLTLLFAFSIGGCATSSVGADAVAEYNKSPLTVAIPSKASADVVEQSMVQVLQGRQWSVQSRSKEKVVGRLVHRGYDAITTLVSDGSVIRILSEGTRKNVHTGEPEPAVPLGWLRNIQKDLNAALGVPQ